MTVRDYIEKNKEKFLGYTIRVCDCDGYELLSFIMKKETDLNNVGDSLMQQLIDDELIHVITYDDGDDGDPQLILTSNCEL